MVVLIPVETSERWNGCAPDDFKAFLLDVMAPVVPDLVYCCFEGSSSGRALEALLEASFRVSSTDILDLGLSTAQVLSLVNYAINQAAPRQAVIIIDAVERLYATLVHRTGKMPGIGILQRCSAIRIDRDDRVHFRMAFLEAMD